LLRYALENKSSQKVVTGKWLLKNEKVTTRLKIKSGQIHKLKTITGAINSDRSDHRHGTKVQDTCI
jgi:hypothetical protein